MGMINCPRHGLTHIFTCCKHIVDAVEANEVERVHVFIDGWGSPDILCERCLEQARSQVDKLPKSPSGGFLIDLDPPLEPYCSGCIKNWYASTGQGNLSETIAQARTNK